MQSAIVTVAVMSFGLICSLLKKGYLIHTAWVGWLLPLECVVTSVSWTMCIFFKENMFVPGRQYTGSKLMYDSIHVCLHLAPFLGLCFDYIAHRRWFRYHAWHAFVIPILSSVYLLWMIFLRSKNDGKWVYHGMEGRSGLEIFLMYIVCNVIMYVAWGLEVYFAPIRSKVRIIPLSRYYCKRIEESQTEMV